MKKFFPVGILIASLLLVSCGQKNLDTVVITPDTPIKNKNQAAKVCEPFIQYITCSIEKASDSKKKDLETALKNMQRKIKNDEPHLVAQECSLYIDRLLEQSDTAFKNGCVIESANTTQEPEAPKTEITPPAKEATPQ